MECISCRHPFGDQKPAASISGSIMGDENTDCLYLCPVCATYTIVSWYDNFTGGDETMSVSGPKSKEEGDRLVALIKRCDNPWDKKCRCAAHVEYFRGQLD
ncbi:MAG: hypothetical protein MUF82_00425 [Bacteroidetes bacterium]|jgi:hypothetical protein|nr:hypothetical protein [Bacteroidota bacterium]